MRKPTNPRTDQERCVGTRSFALDGETIVKMCERLEEGASLGDLLVEFPYAVERQIISLVEGWDE